MIKAAKFMSAVFILGLFTVACQPDTPAQSTEAPMKPEPTHETPEETQTTLHSQTSPTPSA